MKTLFALLLALSPTLTLAASPPDQLTGVKDFDVMLYGYVRTTLKAMNSPEPPPHFAGVVACLTADPQSNAKTRGLLQKTFPRPSRAASDPCNDLAVGTNVLVEDVKTFPPSGAAPTGSGPFQQRGLEVSLQGNEVNDAYTKLLAQCPAAGCGTVVLWFAVEDQASGIDLPVPAATSDLWSLPAGFWTTVGDGPAPASVLNQTLKLVRQTACLEGSR